MGLLTDVCVNGFTFVEEEEEVEEEVEDVCEDTEKETEVGKL